MEVEDIVREICTAIPFCCEKCHNSIRWDRIELLGMNKDTLFIQYVCGTCDRSFRAEVDLTRTTVRKAYFAVLGDRTIKEEVRLRGTPIQMDYNLLLPRLLGNLWTLGPLVEPDPPPPKRV